MDMNFDYSTNPYDASIPEEDLNYDFMTNSYSLMSAEWPDDEADEKADEDSEKKSDESICLKRRNRATRRMAKRKERTRMRRLTDVVMVCLHNKRFYGKDRIKKHAYRDTFSKVEKQKTNKRDCQRAWRTERHYTGTLSEEQLRDVYLDAVIYQQLENERVEYERLLAEEQERKRKASQHDYARHIVGELSVDQLGMLLEADGEHWCARMDLAEAIQVAVEIVAKDLG